jgi:hypothetical protein
MITRAWPHCRRFRALWADTEFSTSGIEFSSLNGLSSFSVGQAVIFLFVRLSFGNYPFEITLWY